MDGRRVFRGLLVAFVSAALSLLAVFVLPRHLAHYVVPASVLVAACGLVLFFRDFQNALRR